MGHIKENDGKGCVFETEADTISGANKQEWGGFSPVLRKNFSGEDISRSRKTDDEFTEISNPRFSFLTTGTPDQVKRLIPTAQDGLYSRFLFYVFSFCISFFIILFYPCSFYNYLIIYSGENIYYHL